MNCIETRRELEEALDRKVDRSPQAEAHLAECADCRVEGRRLEALANLVAAATEPAPTDPAPIRALARAKARAREAAIGGGVAATNWPLHCAWACAAALAFLIGANMRTVQTVDHVVRVPGPERTVRVEVPVVHERIVEKLVPALAATAPVVRYHEEAPGTATASLESEERSATPPAVPAAPSAAAEQPAVIVERIPAPAPAPEITYSETVTLAKVADERAGG